MEKLPVFDYGSINEDHKQAAAEIANFLQNNGHEDLSNIILEKFQIKQTPEYDISKTDLVKFCKEANIFVGIQGFLQENIGTPNAIKYPLISINDDVRKLEELVKIIQRDTKKQL